jgi:hypothetical protein
MLKKYTLLAILVLLSGATQALGASQEKSNWTFTDSDKKFALAAVGCANSLTSLGVRTLGNGSKGTKLAMLASDAILLTTFGATVVHDHNKPNPKDYNSTKAYLTGVATGMVLPLVTPVLGTVLTVSGVYLGTATGALSGKITAIGLRKLLKPKHAQYKEGRLWWDETGKSIGQGVGSIVGGAAGIFGTYSLIKKSATSTWNNVITPEELK